MKWIEQHKLSFILAAIGTGLWWSTGDIWFFVIGAGLFLVAATFRKLFRTMLWIALGAYAAYAIPNGWVFVIVLFGLCMMFPKLRAITPIADFGDAKSK